MFYSIEPMHIPDGFLSTTVSILMWIVSLVVVGFALSRVNRDLDERKLPLMGVLAAAIFAGQMLNFTVIGGTSGHLMGSAIATILLGPWPAVLVLTTVVSVQALIFQDGGLLVLGANIFNMAVVGVFVAHFVYRTIYGLFKGRRWGIYAGGFVAAWISIVVASLAVGLELAISGTSPANIAIPAMAGIHSLIGVGEGLITVGALGLINATRPDLFEAKATPKKSDMVVWIGGLLLVVLLAILSPLASAYPDGLEWVAEQKGFLDISQGPLYQIIPDYVMPGLANEALATIIAGIIGALIVFVVAIGTVWIRRSARD